MIGCLRTRVRKQPIIALYFEFENELKFYYLGASRFIENLFEVRCLSYNMDAQTGLRLRCSFAGMSGANAFPIAGEENQAFKMRGINIVGRIPWKFSLKRSRNAAKNLAAGDGARGKLICSHFEA